MDIKQKNLTVIIQLELAYNNKHSQKISRMVRSIIRNRKVNVKCY